MNVPDKPGAAPEDKFAFFPRKLRGILTLLFLLAGLGFAGYAVLSMYDLLGMSNEEFRPEQGVSAKPFLDPRFPTNMARDVSHQAWPFYKILFCGVGLFALGLLIGRDIPYKKKSGMPLKVEITLLALICLWAAFMRFHESTNFPYGLHYDESTNAMIGLDFIREWELRDAIKKQGREIKKLEGKLSKTENAIEKKGVERELEELKKKQTGDEVRLKNSTVPVFTRAGFGKANMHMYQMGLSMKWFGQSILSMRLPTILAGILGVLMLYLLLRVLTDVPTALLGAAFLAAMRWHVNFSRVAYDAIEAPLIITATAFFFFLAFRHKGSPSAAQGDSTPNTEPGRWKRSWSPWIRHVVFTAPIWLVAGYCFGLSIYSYKPLYIFPGVVGVFVLIRFLVSPRIVKWNVIGLALFLASSYFCAKEMIDFRKANPQLFNERLGMVSLYKPNESFKQNWNRIYPNAKLTLRMYHVRGDSNPRHNHRNAPMLHPLLGTLFPLGVGWALVAWRTRLGLFSLGWFSSMLLPGMLSIEAPQALRTLCVMPVICIFGAVTVRQLGVGFLTLAEDWLPGRRWHIEILRWSGWVIVAALVCVYWWGEKNLYFKDQVRNKEPYLHFDAKFVDMARYVNEQPGKEEGKFFCISDANNHNALILLNGREIWRNHFFLQQQLPARGTDEEGIQYIIMEPENRADKGIWLDWLYSPEVQADKVKNDFEEHIFTAYHVPASVKLKHQGFGWELKTTGEEKAVVSGTEKHLTFDPNKTVLTAPFKMTGKSMWVIPEGQGGNHKFKLQSPDRFSLSIGSEMILNATSGVGVSELDYFLHAGAHQVEFSFESMEYKDLTSVEVRGPRDSNWRPFGGELFHDRGMIPNGLRLKYWHGANKWDAPPRFVWVDPYINYRWNPPYMFPLTMEWEGFLEAPEDGKYTIETRAWDFGTVEINGQKIVESPSAGNQGNSPRRGTIELTKGKHPIRVRYTDDRGGGEALRLYWQLPSGGRAVIPQEALSYR